MSKIYEALEQEERRRRELDRPTIKVAPEALSSVPEPGQSVQTIPQHHETQLWKKEKTVEPEQDMVDLYYTISALTLHKPGQVIQFVASVPGEGSSTIAEEFGRTSAEELGKTVLLLRATENGSSGSRADESASLFDRLMHNGTRVEEIFHKDGEACFFVCPVNHENSVSAFLSSPKVDRVFDKLREYFDLILVDTPSVATSPTGLAMCRKADGVVLIVEAEGTRLPAVENAKQKIQKAGGNILGVILNKYKSHIPGLIAAHL